ncbi:MAG: hypothetical protein IKV05_04325, partial [Bacteroidales bacterium]|nr:hypothetical protein [Bacteroidales bacterium]
PVTDGILRKVSLQIRNRRMRTRMYGGVRGRKTKVGGKPTFVFLLLDYTVIIAIFTEMLKKM